VLCVGRCFGVVGFGGAASPAALQASALIGR
jgi:hypothetical protein